MKDAKFCKFSEISNLLKYIEESHFSRLITTLSNGMLGNNDVTSKETNTSSLSILTSSSFLIRSKEFLVLKVEVLERIQIF